METEAIVNIALIIAYILIAIAAVGVLLGLVVSIAQDVKSGIFAIGGLVLIVVLFGIGYAMSDSDISSRLVAKGIDSVSAYKLSGAGLFTFYALAVVAVIALVGDIVKGFVDGN